MCCLLGVALGFLHGSYAFSEFLTHLGFCCKDYLRVEICECTLCDW